MGHIQLLFLLPSLLISGLVQSQRVPDRQLQTPNIDGESFERLDSTEMREQLKQLLGQQLTQAFAPFATTAAFIQRRPGVVSPNSGAEAQARFAVEEEEEDDEGSNEGSSEEEEQIDVLEEDYNPWRDNFYDLNEDGSYVYGYSLPHGVRRWERGFYSEEQHGQVVEGFYTQPRQLASGLQYELRCYRSDSHGYHPLPVKYLKRAPLVQRDEQPDVECLQKHRNR